MTTDYDCLATTRLEVDAASVSFTSISQDYADLQLVISAAQNSTTYYGAAVVKFNNTTGSYNIAYTLVALGNTGYTGDTYTALAYNTTEGSPVWRVGTRNEDPSNGGWGALELLIPAYTSTSHWQVCLSNGGHSGGEAGVDNRDNASDVGIFQWCNTAAITQIDLAPFSTGSGVWLRGSVFSLYGISD